MATPFPILFKEPQLVYGSGQTINGPAGVSGAYAHRHAHRLTFTLKEQYLTRAIAGIMASDGAPSSRPSLAWRVSSSLVMGGIGFVSRAVLLAANRLEVNGLEGFQELLRRRENPQARERGLITVSNHTSVLDDPLMWGALPFRCHWSPDNMRWSLGSHDIVFKTGAFSTFFLLGQTLPTHRIAHSRFGGPFQPTMTQIIRLLSRQPFRRDAQGLEPRHVALSEPTDPFTDPSSSTYTTNHIDTVPAPSYYASRRHAWIHVFPEGRIHQRQDKTMRYFKWGVARLILEAEPAPTLVPIWIEGFDQMMHESRKWPRFVPRMGKSISVTFGDGVETEELCGDLRRKWQDLVRQEEERLEEKGMVVRRELGHLHSASLQTGEEARRLREECTMRVREEVLKVRRKRGWPDEDPKARLVDTWREEGTANKREGRMEDGSWVKDT